MSSLTIKRPTILDTAYCNPSTNWAVALPFVDGAICKATQGNWVKDAEFPSSWAQLQALNIPRGAYHFYSKAVNSGAQARYFASYVNANGGLGVGDLIVLDVEEQGCSTTAILDCLYNMEILLGRRPILYSRAEILNALSHAKLTDAQKQYMRSTLVWTAGYPYEPDDFNSPPASYIPDQSRYGRVVLWQYAGDQPHVIPGINGGLDFNWVAEDFWLLWKTTTGEVQPPPEEGESMHTGKVIPAEGLKIRRAYPSGTQIGTLKQNDIVYADRIEGGWWHLTKIMRGTVEIPLPGPTCWASGQFIQTVVVEPPPPDDEPQIVTILATYDDGSQVEFIPKV